MQQPSGDRDKLQSRFLSAGIADRKDLTEESPRGSGGYAENPSKGHLAAIVCWATGIA